MVELGGAAVFLAGVRFLARVDARVGDEVAAVGEHFVAVEAVAFVLLHAVMDILDMDI